MSAVTQILEGDMRLILERVDLDKCTKTDGRRYSDHPDIVEDEYYMVIWHGDTYVGKFARNWNGLIFYPSGGGHSRQFYKPGTNASGWQLVWKMTGVEAVVKELREVQQTGRRVRVCTP